MMYDITRKKVDTREACYWITRTLASTILERKLLSNNERAHAENGEKLGCQR
jgi:hypothetical protein